mmetsp:Transcript_39829/g.38395  ORF Transcript_39829/g.38395 Transcript_39829/m.38395 type:complete len:101 (+) Transcript_39829:208-510(+)
MLILMDQWGFDKYFEKAVLSRVETVNHSLINSILIHNPLYFHGMSNKVMIMSFFDKLKHSKKVALVYGNILRLMNGADDKDLINRALMDSEFQLSPEVHS